MSTFRRIMLSGGLDIDIDSFPETQKIYYTATSKVVPGANSIGVVIVNKWNSSTKEGIIVCENDIKEIGNSAFYGCTNLTSVTIPDSVTTISKSAFSGCSSLTSVTIGDSVTSIGEGAFCKCSNLQEFNGKFASEDGRCLIIDGVLNSFAPAGLTEYTIPDGVTTIGNNAFEDCYSLESVTIPDSVTTIGDSAFYNCTKLTSVYCKATTPPSLDGTYVFDSNGSGRKIYVPLESLEVYKSATNWSEYVSAFIYDFENGTIPSDYKLEYTSNNNYIVSPYSTKGFNEKILANVYKNGKGVIYFDNPITSIGNEAFYNCSSLTSVTIPDSVISIGKGAFYGCRNLTSVIIPDSVTTIRDSAFYQCYGLTSITIPDSVTTIGYYAFQNCTKLTSVTIPDSVNSIGSSAFQYCNKLTSVYCKDTTPPVGGSFMFDNNASGRKIYVPMESVEAYKSAPYWYSYANYIEGYNFN